MMDTLNEQVEQLEISEAEPQKEEIWKNVEIEGFEEYQISNLGRIYNKNSSKKDKYSSGGKNGIVDLSNGNKRVGISINTLIKTHFTPISKEEKWEIIKDFGPQTHSVSNYGNVRNNKKGTLMKLQTIKDGYQRITLGAGENKKSYLIQRLVAETFIPNPDNLPEVHHKDQNKLNNHVDNLMWMTSCENCQSINTSKNFGCIKKISKINYQARVNLNKRILIAYKGTKEECQEWLDRREHEARNGLPITEIEAEYSR